MCAETARLMATRLANFAPDTIEDIQTAVSRERRRVARHPELLSRFFRHSALPFHVSYRTLLKQ
jgi:hypothetical protein